MLLGNLRSHQIQIKFLNLFLILAATLLLYPLMPFIYSFDSEISMILFIRFHFHPISHLKTQSFFTALVKSG